MQLRSDFSYMECRTITGIKLLVGLKNERSYIQITREFFDDFYSLYTKLSKGNHSHTTFNDREKMLITIFEKKGFFENSHSSRESFNEYNSFVKIFFKKELSNYWNLEVKNIKLFYISYLSIWLIASVYLFKNFESSLMNVSLRDVSVLEWGILIFIVPLLIYGTHEFGHFIIAKFLGIEVFRIVIGFFVCWPVIYLEYRGLNLNPTAKKLSVVSAGILIHIINFCIGIILTQIVEQNIILNIWLVANVSMILTNLIFIGPSDGYFFITNLLGIYNLRYKGYKALNRLFIKQNILDVTLIEKICGILLIVLWFFSFYGIYVTISYYSEILGISNQVVSIGSIVIIAVLLLRFVINIFKLSIK